MSRRRFPGGEGRHQSACDGQGGAQGADAEHEVNHQNDAGQGSHGENRSKKHFHERDLLFHFAVPGGVLHGSASDCMIAQGLPVHHGRD